MEESTTTFSTGFFGMMQFGQSETKLAADKKIKRLLCSGKVYFDLFEERAARGIDDITRRFNNLPLSRHFRAEGT